MYILLFILKSIYSIIMEVDQNVILHYTNEATFIISLEQYELYYDVILSEIDVDA